MPTVIRNMPEEEYHALPRLSSTGIMNILEDEMLFWRKSWLNKERGPDTGTEAQEVSKAYHAALLEGGSSFYERYARPFEAPQDALRTVEDIRERIRTLGYVPSGSKKAELAAQLLEIDPKAKIAFLLEENHNKYNAGKRVIPADVYYGIGESIINSRLDETARRLLVGEPEVVILWDEGSVPMKARLDIIGDHGITDLKVFAALGRSRQEVARREFFSRRHYIQMAIYGRALSLAKMEGEFQNVASPFEIYLLYCLKGANSFQALQVPVEGAACKRGLTLMYEGIATYQRMCDRYGSDWEPQSSAVIAMTDDVLPPGWQAEIF